MSVFLSLSTVIYFTYKSMNKKKSLYAPISLNLPRSCSRAPNKTFYVRPIQDDVYGFASIGWICKRERRVGNYGIESFYWALEQFHGSFGDIGVHQDSQKIEFIMPELLIKELWSRFTGMRKYIYVNIINMKPATSILAKNKGRVMCHNFGHPALTSSFTKKNLQVKDSFATIVIGLPVLKL